MKSLRLRLSFEEFSAPLLLDVSSLLYDLALLHDFLILLLNNEYKYRNFSPTFFYRTGRKIRETDQLRLDYIEKKSPLSLIVLVPAVAAGIGGLWVFIQALEKSADRRLNRKKLELEVENLERENGIKTLEEFKAQEEFQIALEKKEAWRIYINLLRRLEKNPHRIQEINVLPNDRKEEYVA